MSCRKSGSGMRRREFLSVLGGAAAVWPLAVYAQQGGRMRRVGALLAYAECDAESQSRISSFEQGLHDLGWVKDRNIQIVYRFGANIDERLRDHALDLVRQNPDVLF